MSSNGFNSYLLLGGGGIHVLFCICMGWVIMNTYNESHIIPVLRSLGIMIMFEGVMFFILGFVLFTVTYTLE